MIPTSQSKSNIHPWQIVRTDPNQDPQVIARFRRRNDADEYLRIVRRSQPSHHYEIVFQGAVIRGGDRRPQS